MEKIYIKTQEGETLYGLFDIKSSIAYNRLFEDESSLDLAISMFRRSNDISKVSIPGNEAAYYANEERFNIEEVEIYMNSDGGLIWYGTINIEKNCLIDGRTYDKKSMSKEDIMYGDPDWVNISDDGYVRSINETDSFKFMKYR